MAKYLTKQQAIKIYKQERKDFLQKYKNDIPMLKEDWDLFIDAALKSGKISEYQFNTWNWPLWAQWESEKAANKKAWAEKSKKNKKYTSQGIEIGKSLLCGCCGSGFNVWPEYKDQDQDQGFGICKRCQKDQDSETTKQYEKMWQLLVSAIKNPETKNKMLENVKKDPEMKTVYVNIGISKGFFKWKIG